MESVTTLISLSPLENWIFQKINGTSGSLTKADLENYQFQKLQSTLSLVKEKSPFYQKKLKDSSSKIETLQDWSLLPFTTANELRMHNLQMVTVSQGDIQRVVTLDTSGTSGVPKRCFFTKADQELTIDFFGVGMTSLVSEEDRVLILLPCERPGSVGDLLFEGLSRKDITAIKYGAVQDVQEVMEIIQDQKITSLVGAPSQILALVRWAPVLGIPSPQAIRSVLFSTDHLPDAICQTIEKAWGCEVFNHYGMTETGLGGGVDCRAHYGMHLREADLFFEIIDPISGELVPDGQYGEVVFTTLTREGMPLIRYRTGDISRFMIDPCPCGTSLRTMDWIQYRVENRLDCGEGLVSIADLDEALFSLPYVLNFRVEVEDGHPKKMKIEMNVNQSGIPQNELISEIRTIAPLDKEIKNNQIQLNLMVKVGLPETFGSLAKRKIYFNQKSIN